MEKFKFYLFGKIVVFSFPSVAVGAEGRAMKEKQSCF